MYVYNQNVVHICQTGKMTPYVLGHSSITIEIEWVPRSENVQVDHFWKFLYFDDKAAAIIVLFLFLITTRVNN